MAGYEEFSNPRLVELYELLNPSGPETDFFLSLPRVSDCTVLDVGCGTGLLAVALAGTGLKVTGADPSRMMLDVARNRAGGETVRWIESDAAGFDISTRFDLVLMTNHVFQFLLTDQAVEAALANIRRHMTPNGRLAFETRNPSSEAWLRWNREGTYRTVTHSRVDTVRTWVEVDNVIGDLVDFTLFYEFEAEGFRSKSHNTLRFLEADAVMGHLEAAGYEIGYLWGDWDGSPFQKTSPVIIVVAEAAA